jgi:hypothetical protein
MMEPVSDAAGVFLRAILGPDPAPGPPYSHTLKLPEAEEEMAAAPSLPSMKVIRPRPGQSLSFGTAVSYTRPFPFDPPAPPLPPLDPSVPAWLTGAVLECAR